MLSLQELLPKSNRAIIRRYIRQIQQFPRNQVVDLQVVEPWNDRNAFLRIVLRWQSMRDSLSLLVDGFDPFSEWPVSYEDCMHIFVISIVAVIAVRCIATFCLVPALSLVRNSPADSFSRERTL